MANSSDASPIHPDSGSPLKQNYIKINGKTIKQPAEFEPSWATTYTKDTERVLSGHLKGTPLFTVEKYNAKFTNLTPEQAKELFQLIIPTKSKPDFDLYYYSWFYGEWRTAKFYVGQGSMVVRTLEAYNQGLREVSVNFIGMDPIGA